MEEASRAPIIGSIVEDTTSSDPAQQPRRRRLWVPRVTSARELLAAYLAKRDPDHVLSNAELARRLGLHRNTVAAALADLPELEYARDWVPIDEDLLAAKASIAARVATTEIRRPPSGRKLRDLARELGWRRQAVRSALRKARAANLTTAPLWKAGGEKPNIRFRMHNLGPSVRTTQAPPVTSTYDLGSTYHPFSPPAGSNAPDAPAEDGWRKLRDPNLIEQLEGGAHAPSIERLLATIGFLQGAEQDRHRQRLAAYLALRGVRTERFAAFLRELESPPRSWGLIRSRMGFLWWLVHRPELLSRLDRVRPIAVGREYARHRAAREQLERLDRDRRARIEQRAAELRAAPTWRAWGLRDLLAWQSLLEARLVDRPDLLAGFRYVRDTLHGGQAELLAWALDACPFAVPAARPP